MMIHYQYVRSQLGSTYMCDIVQAVDFNNMSIQALFVHFGPHYLLQNQIDD
jgi:hypothetical protein